MITDVTLMLGPLRGPTNNTVVDERHLHEPVRIATDLWIGPFPMRERVIAACRPPGENWGGRHEWSTYAYWRTNAPYSEGGRSGFDIDRRLAACAQLSRLVRPTSIGYSRAARVIEREAAPIEILPAEVRGRGALSFVADPTQDWLRDEDVEPLRTLVAAFQPDGLPNRVKRSMAYHEYAHNLSELDMRWPLIVTAAEALVHTDERKKVFGKGGKAVTRQFIDRLLKLASLVGIRWTEDELDEVYEHRSGFAHGRGLGGTSEKRSVDSYLRFEAGVRSILRAAILDPNVAGLFGTDQVIRAHLDS